MSAPQRRRVAVTGLGIVTAIGAALPTFRDGLFEGRSGIREVTLFDTEGFTCRSAGQVETTLLRLPFDLAKPQRISRCDRLGLMAVREALSASGLDLDSVVKDRVGVILGGGAGGMLSWERYRREVWTGKRPKKPSLLLSSSPCTLTDLIANHYGFTGARATISTACSSSATSIGYGFDLVRSGAQDMVITGGSEALSELTFAGFNALRLVDPEHCRPFDKNRRGLSLGEGAGFLILEDHDRARARGATIYAEVLGYAINADAYHMTSPDPEASGMSRVMTRALETAGVPREDVHYINAHGTATRVNDEMETKAVKRVFGEDAARQLAVSSTKSMVGHCLGAAGAIEAVTTALALHHQRIPPTIHLETKDPDCDLDYVPDVSRAQEIGVALSNSFAFGGNNTTLVFGRADTA